MPDDASGADRSVGGDRHGEVVAFPSARGAKRLTNNLPLELGSFVGREREIAEIKRLFGDDRLVTLTGPGGSGKTRLALAVAGDLIGEFESGVWWVALASLSDKDLVQQAVASALCVREVPDRSLSETLINHLGSKNVLLVLDNCEHLIGACAHLANDLLRACPNLRILATSREALGVVGETVWSVPPLSSPDLERLPPLEELKLYEAVRLFVERARSATANFELSERNASAVAQLCSRLEGIPLAIELAAARTRALSVEQISSRLEDSFKLLKSESRTVDPRQQTLEATIGWSYELLGEEERSLFRRLSVFAGGFGLGAAEAVCTGGNVEEEDILDHLTRLVDKSLVSVEQGDEARYRLLETVRQYGREKVQESGEARQTQMRHAQYFLALAQEAGPELKGARQGLWLERLEAEHANLRAALGWSLDGGDATLGLQLAGVLGGFWYKRGHLSEGRWWLERELAASTTPSVAERARALDQAGWMALYQGDLEPSVTLLEESMSLFRDLQDEPGVAASLAKLGHAVLHQHDGEYLRKLCEEAEALRGKFVDRRAKGELLVFLGMVALYEGDTERAVALLEESLALFWGLEDAGGVSVCVTYLWMAALEQGDLERATGLLEEELHLLQRLELKPQLQIHDNLMGLAVVAATRGEPLRAARLWGAAHTLRETIDVALPIWEHTPTDFEALLATARTRLGETSWETAMAQGRTMTPEEAIEYALAKEDEVPTAPSPTPEQLSSTPHTAYPAGLSPREAEVLRLVARGMSNTQIAQELFISPRTVNRHMGSIYRKLGVTSRVAAARFATEHDLL